MHTLNTQSQSFRFVVEFLFFFFSFSFFRFVFAGIVNTVIEIYTMTHFEYETLQSTWNLEVPKTHELKPHECINQHWNFACYFILSNILNFNREWDRVYWKPHVIDCVIHMLLNCVTIRLDIDNIFTAITFTTYEWTKRNRFVKGKCV